MQSSYGAPDVTGSRPQHHQLFPPPFLSPNFPIPNSTPSILDMDSQHLQHPQQVHHLQHQFHFVQNQQQQQPSGMMVDPLSKFSFGNRNGGVLHHTLLGLVSGNDGDHQNVNFDAAAVTKHPPLWRYDQNGMAEPQFKKFLEEQVFSTAVNPNYRQLGSVYAPQAPEFENKTSGSAGEIHQHLEFPNVLHINRGDGGGGKTELKNKHKCSSLESNTEKEEEDKKLERQLERMARALEGRILAHQERLYESFMEKIDKLEKERIEREESWRAAEAERTSVRAAARARELAVASSQEAVIVSYLERITGEKILLPNPSSPSPPPPAEGSGGGRWPKPEVEALVRVRSKMEAKFREQGQKAALWEEVSSTMGRIGHQRSAKSCKEKWENINKYYSRKSKDEANEEKKRAPKRRLKTCSYFDQLDKLYSRQDAVAAQALQVVETDTDSKMNNVNNSSSAHIENTGDVESKDGGEDQKGGGVENELLLEAMLDNKSNADPSQSKSDEAG